MVCAIARRSTEAGRAGIYTISISEILTLTESMFQKQAAAEIPPRMTSLQIGQRDEVDDEAD